MPRLKPDQFLVWRLQDIVVAFDQRSHRIHVVASNQKVHRYIQPGGRAREVEVSQLGIQDRERLDQAPIKVHFIQQSVLGRELGREQ